MAKAITRTTKKIRDQIYISTGRAIFVMVFLVVVGVFAGTGLKDMMGYSKAPMPEKTQTTSQTEEVGMRKVAANDSGLANVSVAYSFVCFESRKADTWSNRVYYQLKLKNETARTLRGKLATFKVYKGNILVGSQSLDYWEELASGAVTPDNYLRFYVAFLSPIAIDASELKWTITANNSMPTPTPIDFISGQKISRSCLVPDFEDNPTPTPTVTPSPTVTPYLTSPVQVTSAFACYQLNMTDHTKDRVSYSIALKNILPQVSEGGDWNSLRGKLAELSVGGTSIDLIYSEPMHALIPPQESRTFSSYMTIPNLRLPLTAPWTIKDITTAKNVLFSNTVLPPCASGTGVDLEITQHLACYRPKTELQEGRLNYTLRIKNLTNRTMNENLVKIIYGDNVVWTSSGGALRAGQEVTIRGYVPTNVFQTSWTVSGALSKKLIADGSTTPTSSVTFSNPAVGNCPTLAP